MTDCICGQPATRRVVTTTIPGRGDGRLITLDVCAECYVREDWADHDLSGQLDMWGLATGQALEEIHNAPTR